MQDVPLTIDLILRRAVEQGHGLHAASAGAEGVRRIAWSEVGERTLRLADVLDRLGASSGARVGTFAWNTHRHLEHCAFLGRTIASYWLPERSARLATALEWARTRTSIEEGATR